MLNVLLIPLDSSDDCLRTYANKPQKEKEDLEELSLELELADEDEPVP